MLILNIVSNNRKNLNELTTNLSVH